MSEFIMLLVIGVFVTWGVHCIFSEGFILEKLGNKLRQYDPAIDENDFPAYRGTWYSKPLFDCPPCMASVYGFTISAVYYDWHIFPMIAYIICLCGVNFILKKFIYPDYE